MPAARSEITDAKKWYDAEAPELGIRFHHEVDSVVRRIASNPLQFPVVYNDLRRARLRRFPYQVFFRVLADSIYVIARFHGRRDPKIWQGRA